MSTKAVLKRSGFTLIELLVVIAIIGLLVAMLVPSLNEAKWQAKIAQCQAGLHSIGVAQQGYMTTFGMDTPWPYNNGTFDGLAESSYNYRARKKHVEGNTPGNPAEALLANLMADDMPIPDAWRNAPTFLETADAFFCPASSDKTVDNDFDVWGDKKITDHIWGTYPYVYPHVLPADDPFHVPSGTATQQSRLAHSNSRLYVGRTSKNVVMYDDWPDYIHFNGLLLNGVVEVLANSGQEFDDFIYGKGNLWYN